MQSVGPSDEFGLTAREGRNSKKSFSILLKEAKGSGKTLSVEDEPSEVAYKTLKDRLREQEKELKLLSPTANS